MQPARSWLAMFLLVAGLLGLLRPASLASYASAVVRKKPAVVPENLHAPLGPAAVGGVVPIVQPDPIPALKKSIAAFHRRWRDQWRESIKQNDSLFLNVEGALSDDTGGIPSARALRVYALSCAVGFYNPHYIFEPRLIGSANRLPPISRRRSRPPVTSVASFEHNQFPRRNLRSTTRVSARGNETAVCPQWIPEDAAVPPEESEWVDFALPPSMRASMHALRDSLVQRLVVASAAHPTNDWIAGQLVRFLLDNRAHDRAFAAVRDCRASPGWCDALRGLVYAVRGDVPAAAQAFQHHLRAAVPARGARCADTTARVLLDVNDRLRSLSQSCGEWAETTARLWWLSDPLWSVAGNERFVEHYARITRLALQTALDEDERYIWRKTAAGDALQEVFVRYGWPSVTIWGSSFADERLASYARDSLRKQAEYPYSVKEYARNRVAFVPTMPAVRDPFAAGDADWRWTRPDDLRWDQWWPAEHMVPQTHLRRLPAGQSVVLRRDSSLLLAFAIDDPIKELDASVDALPKVVLVQSTGPDDLRHVTDTVLPFGRSLRVTASIASVPSLLSLEVANRVATEPAHRQRFGIRPPPTLAQMQRNEVALSDPAFLLLPAYGAPPPTHPDSAIARLAGGTQLPRDVPLALYWESYGFALGDTVEVEVSIVRRDGNALRAVAAFFGLANAQNDSITIRWREPDLGRNARDLGTRVVGVARSVAVDIRNLAPGNYAFIVAMTRPDGTKASGERRVEVVRE